MELAENDTRPDQRYMRSEVANVLQALNDNKIKYAVFASAACVHHGGQWLWESKDYEVYIEDWFDGPVLQRAVNVITTRCSPTWEYDHSFNDAAWALARGDRPPTAPVRRLKHVSSPLAFGVLLVPAVSSYISSMHHDDLVNEEVEQIWIYPDLKNYVESQLRLWSYEGRNSALLDLADVVGGRRLSDLWATEVGLEVSNVKRRGREHLPSDLEMWNEILRMAREHPDRQRATARFRARKAEKETLRRAEANDEARSEGHEMVRERT